MLSCDSVRVERDTGKGLLAMFEISEQEVCVGTSVVPTVMVVAAVVVATMMVAACVRGSRLIEVMVLV